MKLSTGCVRKNDKRLADHLKAVKSSFSICFDCADDFNDTSDIYIYGIDDTLGCFNRIRSIKARETALDDELYVPLCSDCRRVRLKEKREERRKKMEEAIAKERVEVNAFGEVIKSKPKKKGKNQKAK